MLGIDTNVLVRFLVRDEERQFGRAQRLLRREAERGQPVFVSHLVLLETEWVLRSRYGLSQAEILGRSLGCSSRQNCRSRGNRRSSRRCSSGGTLRQNSRTA